MSELGQQLREARLQKGMSLDDVQEMTKIRKRYLEAIEAGDYKVLPGSFYVRAFIKTYAEAVGINPEELLEGHKQDVPKTEAEPTMEPVIQKRASRPAGERNMKWLPTLLMWTFPILIVVVIYLVATHSNKSDAPPVSQNDQTQTDQGQQQTTQTPGDGDGAKGSGTTGETGGDTNGEGTEGTDGTDAADGTEGTDNTDSTDGTDGTGTDSPDDAVPGQTTVTQDRTEGKNTIFKVTGSNVKVELVAGSNAQSWVEVYRGKNSSGEKLFFGMLENGAAISYDLDSQGMYVKSGNSTATTIKVGGQTVTDGKTTSRIILEPAEAATE